MAIQLRERPNQDGTVTLYLDIYHRGKRRYEFLKQAKLIQNPKTQKERQDNKTTRQLAEKILRNRAEELDLNDYDLTPKFKQQVDFVEFFAAFLARYKKKDRRIVQACYHKFVAFLNEADIKQLTARELKADLVKDFREYLSDNLTGESPANYFKKFKLVIKDAIRKDVLIKNPAEGQSIKAKTAIRKAILTPDEINRLAATPATNTEMKRAAIVSLFTGLRFADIVALKWSNIDISNKRLEFSQSKTGEMVSMNLHPTAVKALGTPLKNTTNVFTLPSHTAITKGLKHWVKKAGINKKITWHCFRHSFATNIIYFGADVNTASKLLGHTSFRYTERYTHIVKSLKEKAISNLPSVEF
jgi:integrase/recombinase XerD